MSKSILYISDVHSLIPSVTLSLSKSSIRSCCFHRHHHLAVGFFFFSFVMLLSLLLRLLIRYHFFFHFHFLSHVFFSFFFPFSFHFFFPFIYTSCLFTTNPTILLIMRWFANILEKPIPSYTMVFNPFLTPWNIFRMI